MRSYIIGFILFTGVIIAGVTLMGEYGKENPGIDTSQLTQFNESFNKLTDLQGSIQGLKSSTEAEQDSSWADRIYDATLGRIWTAIKLIGNSFDFIDTVLEDAAYFLKVPQFVVSIISLIVTVIIIFAIWGIFFSKN